MKNASRILSIFFTVFMLVGCMTAFATETSAAGELSVTFLDESGDTIAVVPFDGTITVNALLAADSAEAALVNTAIAQTDTKVFAGWTLTDGTVVGGSAEITESTTVKASYSNYKVYTSTNLAGLYRAGNLVISKFSYDNKATNVFRIRSTSTVSHVVEWAIAFDNPDDADKSPEIDTSKLINNAAATREYEVFVAKYKTNQSNNASGSNTSWIQIYDENGATVATDGYNGSNTNTKKRIEYTLSPTSVTSDGTGIDDITAVYDLSMVKTDTKISGFRFAPWSGATITNANGPAATDRTAAYVDIEYFALFEKAEAVQYFDYELYNSTQEDVKITYKVNIDGKEVTLGSYAEGTIVTLPEAEAADGKIFVGYKNSKGDFVTEAAATEVILEYTSVFRNIPTGDYINERGNLANLKAKIEDGKLNVAFLGGSVTAGAGATGRGRWGSQVIDYLRAEYPDVEINEFNAGIGGTGSRLGAYRLADDIIARDPDLVFVEVMLNDAYNGEYVGNVYKGKYYEYIMRTIREEVPDAEIISIFITNNGCAKNYGYGTVHPIGVEEDKIAANYDVTTIDVGRYLLESIFDGDKEYDEVTWNYYFTDSVHPGNLGYTVYTEVIAKYLDGIKTAEGEAKEYIVPETYIYPMANGFTPNTIPLTLDGGQTINPALENVTGFTLASRSGTPAYPYYLVPAAEASFEFEFTGTELAFYMDSPNEGSTIKVTVDGVTKSADGQDDTNGPKEFFEKLENTTHTAKIELTGVETKGNVIGILVGVDTYEPEPIDPSTIDCIIKTAEDIVADGVLTELIDNATTDTKCKAGKVELKNLTEDGMARFGVKEANVGVDGTANDRMLIAIDDVVFADYPYAVLVYKTNIESTELNFNMTTKDAVVSAGGDHKKFFKQTRVAGELATGVANWSEGSFGAEGKVTGIYIPIFNKATDVKMDADDYFDVQYVGFFKNAEDAEAFDYEAYLENKDEVVPGDVNGDGAVDRKDLTRLAQYFARWTVEIDEAAADANGDGEVDRKDLTRLAQYFARWDVTLGE